MLLLEEGKLDFSRKGVEDLVATNTWWQMDDARILELLKEMYSSFQTSAGEIARDHIAAVLHRRPAKLVYQWERLSDGSSNEAPTHEALVALEMEKVTAKFGLSLERFHVWTAPFKLSAAGPLLNRMFGAQRQYTEEEEGELIHLLDKGHAVSRPLIDAPNSVSHHMAKLRYETVRVYFLPDGGSDPKTVEAVRGMFAQLPN